MRCETENWRPVASFEKYYEVSDLGRVRSVSRVTVQGHLLPSTVLRPWADKDGYLRVVLCVDAVRTTSLIHRLVAEAFLGVDEGRPFVNHKDGHTGRNLLENLEWVTQCENTQHAIHVLGRQYGRPPRALIAVNDIEELHFDGVADARKAGFQKAGIYFSIRGQRSHHKGYRWRFAA